MVDVVSDVVINYKSTGLDKVGQEIKQVSTNLDGLVIASTGTEKATASLENRFKSLERTLSTSEGQAAKFAKVQDTVNKAVAQNPELQGRANEVLASAAARYGQVEKATTGLANAHKGLDAQGQAAFHSMRSVFEQLALGVSPVQALTGQLNHLAFAATGEGGIVGAFKQAGGFISGMISPLNLAIAGVTGLGAAVAYLALQWDNAQKAAERGLTGAGRGTSIADLNKFQAANASASGLSMQQAQAAGIALAKTGDIAIESLHGVGEAIQGYAILTGKDVPAATADMVKALTSGAKGVDDLNKVYMDFSATERDYIRALDAAGAKTAAAQIMIDGIANSNRKAKETVNVLTAAWEELKNTIANIGQGPAQTIEQKIAAKQQQLTQAESMPSLGFLGVQLPAGGAEQAAQLRKELEALKAEANDTSAAMKKMSIESDNVARALIPQINQVDNLIASLDKLQEAKAKGVGGPNVDAAIQAAQNQLALAVESQEQARRYNERVAEIARSWGDVGQEVALQLQTLKNNLQVSEAVGGAAKMAAQAAADYANAIAQGKTETEAAALAAAKLAQAIAEANSKSKESVIQTQNSTEAIQRETAYIKEQTAIGSQMRGDQAAKLGLKQREMEDQAKINELIRQGVSAEQAATQAAAERVNSNAKITQEVAKRIQTADQEIEMAHAITHADEMRITFQRTYNALRAQGVGHAEAELVAQKEFLADQEKVNKEVQKEITSLNRSTEMIYARVNGEEAAVASAQAYADAIERGASATVAAAKAAAVLANEIAKADAAAIQEYNNMLKAVQAEDFARRQRSLFEPRIMPTAPLTFVADPNLRTSYAQGGTGKRIDVGQFGGAGTAAANATFEAQWMANKQAYESFQNTGNAVSDLTSSVDDLKKSTDNLNATNQDLLSPYYTQDPRTSHIGFRSQGMALGGYVEVPGGYSTNDNMVATIPVASGERIYVDPMGDKRGIGGTGSTVINISSPITINGNADKDQFGRTVYQSNQQLAKQVRNATQ